MRTGTPPLVGLFRILQGPNATFHPGDVQYQNQASSEDQPRWATSAGGLHPPLCGRVKGISRAVQKDMEWPPGAPHTAALGGSQVVPLIPSSTYSSHLLGNTLQEQEKVRHSLPSGSPGLMEDRPLPSHTKSPVHRMTRGDS